MRAGLGPGGFLQQRRKAVSVSTSESGFVCSRMSYPNGGSGPVPLVPATELRTQPRDPAACAMLCLVTPHIRLFETPGTVAHQPPLSMGIFQARILQWVAMPSTGESSPPKDQVSCTAGGFFTI